MEKIQGLLLLIFIAGALLFSGILTSERLFHVLKRLKRENRETEGEIARDMAFLRNLLKLNSGKSLSLDHILTRLSEKEGPLKKSYIAMVQSLRIQGPEKALESFVKETQGMMAKEYGNILLKWDELDPTQLQEILYSHQKTLRETIVTEKIGRDEMISDLIFLPAVVNILLILINFIYTTYYVRQMEVFTMLF
ncbi:MAG: hypothetical protein WCY49_00345 [Anaerovoracaceae bacterium]|nr:hypothetical protein [Clostridiales bacterium]